jgi:hypothetical protein
MANKNLFNSIQLQKPKKNVFDLTHDVKLSAKMGNLTPIMVTECVPGDMFQLGCESLIRFAPMIAPVMHRMDVSMHYFFVPNRILWDNWEKFIVDANTNLVAPYMQYDNSWATAGTTIPLLKFMDYMGVPPITSTSAAGNFEVNALPFAAYQAIYNEYYRDQNLVNEVNYKLTDGNNVTSISRAQELLTMRKRAWEHDYFTAALPFAQKGAAVDIPIGAITQDTPVYYNSSLGGVNTDLTNSNAYGITIESDAPSGITDDIFAATQGLDVGATTINDLRRAFRLQEWLEKNARGGTRYIENILAHFGVKSSDKRLQRPEYITGIKSPVVISEVLNTTGEQSGLPQGNMAGHGISVSSGKYGSYFCEEHGYIIGIMSVMPKTAYQQGIPKTYLKNDPLDYFWPSFAHIGEQPITKNELYAYTANANDVFGYIPRYAEYKYMPSRVAGDFRNTLDYWHLGRIFATEPNLNQTFIECNSDDVDRIFAVQSDEDYLYCHVLNKIRAVRPMPKFGTPSF